MNLQIRAMIAFILVLAAAQIGAEAQVRTWQYCDASRAYYPMVTTCAVPWRTIVERPQFPSQAPPGPSEPTHLTGTPSATTAAPSVKVVSHATEGEKPDNLNGWCAKVSQPSSIVICSDSDLRRMSMARTQLFKDAAENLSPELYKTLLDDQARWVKSYAENCGTPADGPRPTVPIAPSIIDCYKRAGRARISLLISTLQRSIPNYEAPSNWVQEIAFADRLDRERQDKEAAAKADQERREAAARAERERQEAENKAQREREDAATAAKAREQLREQAAAEHKKWLDDKLKGAGYSLISPIDFELDWRDLWKNSKKIALIGQYIQIEEVDGLAVNNKDSPVVRLYTDDASRDARKMMLECRTSNYSKTKCRLAVGGVVQKCVRNQGQLNEREIPCIAVIDEFLIPEDVWDTVSDEH